jgi:hypothetical protein
VWCRHCRSRARARYALRKCHGAAVQADMQQITTQASNKKGTPRVGVTELPQRHTQRRKELPQRRATSSPSLRHCLARQTTPACTQTRGEPAHKEHCSNTAPQGHRELVVTLAQSCVHSASTRALPRVCNNIGRQTRYASRCSGLNIPTPLENDSEGKYACVGTTPLTTATKTRVRAPYSRSARHVCAGTPHSRSAICCLRYADAEPLLFRPLLGGPPTVGRSRVPPVSGLTAPALRLSVNSCVRVQISMLVCAFFYDARAACAISCGDAR